MGCLLGIHPIVGVYNPLVTDDRHDQQNARRLQSSVAVYLREFNRKTRRANVVYYPTIAATVCVCIAVYLVAQAHGPLSHVRSRVATDVSTTGPQSPVGASLTSRWLAAGPGAVGFPASNGVVAVEASRGVEGLSAHSGQTLWSFERTDRTMCGVAQLDNRTIILYRQASNCDEVDAVDTTTGARVWERTLDADNVAVDGEAKLKAVYDAVYVIAGSAIYSLSVPNSRCDSTSGQGCGLSFWQDKPDDGCTFSDLVAGDQGVLITEACRSERRLIVRERYTRSDKAKRQIFKHTSLLPLGADKNLLAYDSTSGEIFTLTTTSSVRQPSGKLPVPPSEIDNVQSSSSVIAIHAHGKNYGLGTDGGSLWDVFGESPITFPAEGFTAYEASTASSIVALDTGTGSITGRYAVSGLAAQSRIFRSEAGFVVCDAATRYLA